MGFKPIPAAVALVLTLLIWFVIKAYRLTHGIFWHCLSASLPASSAKPCLSAQWRFWALPWLH